jgi:glycosyltransferase involved in cell wall biosynthesis
VKILQITKKFPYPVKDGEVIGILNLTMGFAALGHEVTVLSLNTRKHYFNPKELPASIQKIARFIAVDIDTKLNPVKAFVNLFTNESYNIERFYSKEFEQKIVAILEQEHFDFVLLEGIYLMRYIAAVKNGIEQKSEIRNQKSENKEQTTQIVLRPQNVEYVIWERLRDTETNPFKKWYLALLAKRMKAFEIMQMNQADLLIPVSQTDLDIFKQKGCHLPSIAIPTGYVYDALPAIDSDKEENAVVFIGGMDWMPNREGVEWFLEKVWVKVLTQLPHAKFYLAGRNFPDEIRTLKVKGLVIVGEVEDAKAFISSKAISIVPLFAGSGMRVKIVEAMALGRAVISTSIGAESLAYTHGKDILIADDAQTFADEVVRVLSNKTLRLSLGNFAQQLVEEVYDNRKISQRILDFVKLAKA